jgi:hypothetical protein
VGIGFVLIAWIVIGSVVAAIGALALWGLVGYLTRQARQPRGRLLSLAAALPFLSLAWAAIVFVFQATINVALLHRDIGIGDGFECPLPDGYALTFIDTTEIGTVYKDNSNNGIQNVRFLQLADPYIIAASDSKAFDHFGQQTAVVDTYSLIDTRNGHRTQFTDVAALRQAAERLHITVSISPIGDLYSKYRFTWFDGFAAILLIVPPALGVVWLFRWTLQVRRNTRTTGRIA